MNTVTSIDPQHIDVREMQQHLVAAVAPRPICFASTLDKKGKVNLSPFSFFNVFSANPPILIFSPSRRGRDNTLKHTYENIMETQEVVISMVNHAMVEQMSLSSTEYDKGVNEFEKAGLTEVKSSKVRPPRVGESPIAFECTVDKVIPLGEGPGAGNLVLARVVLMHVQNDFLDASGKPDTQQLDLVARMGGNWYCRASGASLFEIPKPLSGIGIGVDQLPTTVQNSEILTGNDLGRLGNVKNLPDKKALAEVADWPEIKELLLKVQHTQERRKKLHILAQSLLHKGNTVNALKILLFSELLKADG